MNTQYSQLELLRCLNLAVVVHAPDTRIIYSNILACELLGLTEEQMQGKKGIDPAWNFITEQGIVMPLADYPVNRIISSRQRLKNLVVGIVSPHLIEPNWVSVDGFPEFDLNGELTQIIINFYDVTNLKKAQEQLRQSEELLRLSSELANVAAWERDLVTGTMTRSSNHDKLYGLSELGTYDIDNFINATHPEDREKFTLFIDNAIAQGGADQYKFDFRIHYPDQSIHWLNVVGQVIARDENGVGTKLRGFITDITDRKQAELAVHKSQKLLAETEQIGKVGGWEFNIDTGKQTWTEEVFHIHELDPDSDPSIASGINFYTPTSKPIIALAVDRIIKYGEPFDLELEIITAKGNLRNVHAIGRADFENRRVYGFFQDITDRIQAEVQLRIAATAFESQQGMMVTDINKSIISVNKAFTTITGYSPEQAIGQTPSLLQSGRHEADFYQSLWASVDAHGSWQGEIWNRRQNGEIYPEILSITAVKNDQGHTSHYVGVFSDISARKAIEEKVEHLAFYDSLTGLPNRLLLIDRMQQALSSSVRSGAQTALLFVDLDEFKNINDTAGHPIGDKLLQMVAKRLESSVREGDTVARWGGDEFVVLLEGLNSSTEEAASQAASIGEKILSLLAQNYRLDGFEHQCTASIGVTLVDTQNLQNIDNCLQQADLAMYQAKGAGKNTLRFFEPQMQASMSARVALQTDLRQAIYLQQFSLHYQAQVAEGIGIVGVEALIRWTHPEHGLIPPANFIHIAEETGLILPIGSWVLETACSQLASWANIPVMADLSISVNVSARQFMQVDWVDQVLAIIKNTGANPNLLKLELTESMLAQNTEDIIGKMTLLKAHGIGFSLDDFGTGYSSLSYLKLLPMDQLKIDSSFVRDILIDPNDSAIAQMVIGLAKNLGLTVIAEGVETEAQRNALSKLGCNEYQGYLYSKPLPIREFEAFLNRFEKSALQE
ncbi:sensor domain-containing protein [Alishewanella sp. HL-SH05]|uniref:sensor domain-containing protein n=1 Tax=Alishewanella sp. HL-SH05 TaxID=3461145 RepID=UPI0040420173